MKHIRLFGRFGALLLAVLTLALVATSCNTKVVGPAKIEVGKKYICSGTVGLPDEEDSFQFEKDGTGKYCYYDTYSDDKFNMVFSYTISFLYTVDPETRQIFCFFDSIEYNEEHTAPRNDADQRTWHAVLNYSEHVLTWDRLSTDSTRKLYVCENYLSEIPNFRNTPEE